MEGRTYRKMKMEIESDVLESGESEQFGTFFNVAESTEEVEKLFDPLMKDFNDDAETDSAKWFANGIESGKINKKYIMFFAAMGFSTMFRHWIQRKRQSNPFMEMLARMAESDSEEKDE